MKLNEIKFIPSDAEQDDAYGSLKAFFAASPNTANTVKNLMMEEEIDGHYYRELMNLKPDFTVYGKTNAKHNKRYNSLSEVVNKFTRRNCAYAIHTRYDGLTNKFDLGKLSISSLIKINRVTYRLMADSGEYFETTSGAAISFASLRHDLDQIALGAKSNYYGWLIFG